MADILSLPLDVLEYIFSYLLFIPPSMCRHPLEKKKALAMNIDVFEQITKQMQQEQLKKRENPTISKFGYKSRQKSAIDVACGTIFLLERVCKTWKTAIEESQVVFSSCWIYIQYFEKEKPLEVIEKIIARKTNSGMKEDIVEFMMKRNEGEAKQLAEFLQRVQEIATKLNREEQIELAEKQCIQITRMPEFRKMLLNSDVNYVKFWKGILEKELPEVQAGPLQRILREFLINTGVCISTSLRTQENMIDVCIRKNNWSFLKTITEALKDYEPKRKNKEVLKDCKHIQAFTCNAASHLLDTLEQWLRVVDLKQFQVIQGLVPMEALRTRLLNPRVFIDHVIIRFLNDVSEDTATTCINMVDYISKTYKLSHQAMRAKIEEPVAKTMKITVARGRDGDKFHLVMKVLVHLANVHGLDFRRMRLFHNMPSNFDLPEILFLVRQFSYRYAKEFKLLFANEGRTIVLELLKRHTRDLKQVYSVIEEMLKVGVDKTTLFEECLSKLRTSQSKPPYLTSFEVWAKQQKYL